MAYKLQKYKSIRTTKNICPACNRRSFVLYVNEGGVALHPTVGRCDHESSCGYHLKPRDFFADHPELTPPASWQVPAKIERKPLCTIPHMFWHMYNVGCSVLEDYLCTVFDETEVGRVFHEYSVGSTADGQTIYWQIDEQIRIRGGKVMLYGPDGHRIKDAQDRVSWMHSYLKRDGHLPADWELTQCLFGLQTVRANESSVWIVESEKTALVCAIATTGKRWLATGGKYNLKPEVLAPLTGKRIYLVPDADALDEWREKADKLQQWFDITVVDPGYTEEDKQQKRDIADLILRDL